MSHAFIRESDEQWLHDIPPTMSALITYLTRENNGIRVYEKSSYVDSKTGRQVFVMSNGFAYAVDADNRWFIAE